MFNVLVGHVIGELEASRGQLIRSWSVTRAGEAGDTDF